MDGHKVENSAELTYARSRQGFAREDSCAYFVYLKLPALFLLICIQLSDEEEIIQALSEGKDFVISNVDSITFEEEVDIARLCRLLMNDTSVKKIYHQKPIADIESWKMIGKVIKNNKAIREWHFSCFGAYTEIPLITADSCKFLFEGLQSNSTMDNLSFYKYELAVIKPLYEVLKVNRTLKALHIENCKIGSDGANWLAESLALNSGIEILYMTDNTDCGADGYQKIMDSLKKNTTLKKLVLARTDLTQKDFESLASLIKVNNNLQYLSLTANDEGFRLICEALNENKSIRRLQFEECKLSEESYEYLYEAMKNNQTIQKFTIWSENNNDGQFELYDIIAENKALKKITINDIILSDHIEVMGDALKSNNTLEDLELWESSVDDKAMFHICEGLKHNRSLKYLGLGGSEDYHISAEGCAHFYEAMKVNKTLLDMSFRSAHLETAGSQWLAKVFSVNSTLTRLNLYASEIDGPGCKAICDALKNNKSLKVLEMQWNPIGPEGILAIADMLLVNTTLHTLKILERGRTSDLIPFFKALQVNSSLTELRCEVKKRSVGALDEALQNNFNIRKFDVRKKYIRLFRPYIQRNNRLHEENISNTKIAAKVITGSQIFNVLPKELWRVIFNMIQYPGTTINFSEAI